MHSVCRGSWAQSVRSPVFSSPTGYVSRSFGFSFTNLRYIPLIPLEWWVIILEKPWTSTGYFSNSTGSSVTAWAYSSDSVRMMGDFPKTWTSTGYFSNSTGSSVPTWAYSIDSVRMMGDYPEKVLNFNRLLLKLNRFICNYISTFQWFCWNDGWLSWQSLERQRLFLKLNGFKKRKEKKNQHRSIQRGFEPVGPTMLKNQPVHL